MFTTIDRSVIRTLKESRSSVLAAKRDDPEKTGQHGVGFNAVYHLTDCPSFLSNNDTLCFLDPHCRYAPGRNT